MTEILLAHDYRVVFFYRDTSAVPFLHNDRISLPLGVTSKSLVPIDAHTTAELVSAELEGSQNVALFNKYLKERKLVLIPYSSVQSYLSGLSAISSLLAPLSSHLMLILAAAVSDFYIPSPSPNKVQSGVPGVYGDSTVGEDNSLSVRFTPVPKRLGELKKVCPSATVISFKLETDPGILMKKVEQSFKYGVDAIVGNILKTRYDTCYFSTLSGGGVKGGKEEAVEHVKVDKKHGRIIEYEIVELVVGRHYEGMAKSIPTFTDVARKVRGRRLERWLGRNDVWKLAHTFWDNLGPWFCLGVGWALRYRWYRK
jgi:phosphopantothenate-cysteine ligase